MSLNTSTTSSLVPQSQCLHLLDKRYAGYASFAIIVMDWEVGTSAPRGLAGEIAKSALPLKKKRPTSEALGREVGLITCPETTASRGAGANSG